MPERFNSNGLEGWPEIYVCNLQGYLVVDMGVYNDGLTSLSNSL